MTFDEWLPKLIAFKQEASKVLGRKAGEHLQYERDILEQFYWQALDTYADAESYYRQAKLKKAEDWIAAGRAVSAAMEWAKTAAYKELWARDTAEALVKATESRKIAVAQALKLMSGADR